MGTSGANSSYYILSDEGYANSTNLIVNPGFERSSNWNGSTVLFTRENNSDARTGDYAMKAKRASNPTTNFKYQDVNVYQGGTYTFSAYIKSVNNSNVNDANLYLRVAAYNASGTATVTKLEKVNNIDGEWQRYYITIDAPDGTKKIRVGFGFNDSIGEYYLDDLQLELANTPSEFNLIENGSFSNRTTNWSVSGSSTISNQSLFNAITPTLNVNGNFVAYQTIAVNGKKDDVFSLGAWFKGNFVKSDPTNSNLVNILMTESGELFHYTENRFTQIEASYQYTVEDEDGTTHTETDKLSIPFEQFITDWQFANDEFALKGDTNEITVLLRYENNLNPASFTDVQLIKENDAVVLDTETDASGENTETETCPCEQCEENDCVCRCADETSCTCVQCKRRTSINTTDSFGNTLSNSSFDGTKSIVTSTAYTSNGNYVESSTDADNATTTYSYDTLNGLLMSVTDPNGNEIDYIYDAFGLLTQVSLATNNQKSANYVYTNDRLTGISNNGTTYLISYNLWGELQSVSVGSQPIITYSYGEGASRSRITQVDYANGTTVCYSYDLAGNVIFVEVQSDDYYKSFNYEYDAQNNLSEISATDVRTVRYTDGRTDILDCDGEYIYSSYTDNNDFIEVINGVTYTTKDYDSQYDYTTGETVSKSDVTSSAGKTVGTIFKTDWFGRTTEAVVQTKSANNTDSTVSFAKITTQYGYPSYADNKTSDRVLYVTNRVTYGSTTQAQKKFYGLGYSYDSNGNITGEYTRTTSGSQSLKKSYFYDELNQLTRVNDITADKTYTYTYDNAGNIVEKKEYPYISDETIADIPDTRTVYSYDSSWGDKLVSYTIYDSEDNIIEQKNFNYDNIGNPTSIGADTLTWSGRELTSYTKGNKSIAYTYDENGLRSTKTVTSGNTTERYDYVWSDGRLISQSYTDNEGTKSAKFIYGSAGDVQGFIYNDVTYLYVKNLQGDIIAIVNENGDEVVKISYDVWGKPTYSTGSLGNNQLLGLFEKLSPFSYRGYCYDTDIELYYLQSRYYNPELCRFINTDDTNIAIQTQGDILGVNLFAYCENIPIMFVDYSGFIPLLIYGLAVIIIIVVAVVAYTYIKQQVEKYYKRLNRALPNMNRIKYKIL